MYVSMLIRKFVIEAIYSALFLIAFHWVAATPFEMFVIFGLFTIFLRLRTGNDSAELRAHNFLLMRMIFDEKDLLSRSSDEQKDSVGGEYSGQIFSRIISWVTQAWMLFWIVRSVF
ncbi:hypothetical protein EH240_35735 [Mesorhizobium tamadayense]|uniref:Uncharacterized protein n=1 Tax=Mesorhizobium tamadayense TaxID=425306 RepID=A0A3P3ENR7_9HYPH|nr:hypothetical protein [Mesorhizobium tamadayense]RRH87841.1 hypothetical protein EH240_35735 [Mesorhizobium tamadayense]